MAEPVPASSEAVAAAAAQEAGEPVLVEPATTETTEVWANPDGTFTATSHARPVRVKRSGAWTDIDPDLVRSADGAIRPKAAVVDLELSAGEPGDPLARASLGDVEVGLGWIEDLPAPTIFGPTATYAEVLPGVDLRVTADGTGFSQVLVVKTPQAASDPRLRRVTFASHAQGVTVSATPEGRLAATDPTGQVVFAGDASRMWDSSGDASDADQLLGTGEGLRTATMGVEVTDSTLTIVPDQEFLTAPDTTYPVYLDPSYSCTTCKKTHHNVVQSAFPGTSNYDRTDDVFGDLKAGYWCGSGDCPGINRTFLQINTSQLLGRDVQSAYLHVDVVHSAECAGATATRLAFVRAMNRDTKWNNQPGGGTNPGVYRWLGSGNVTNNARYCPDEPGMDLEATLGVEDAVAAGFGETTFMLSGSSESTSTSWRRFDLNPYLVAKYNSRPNVPDRLGAEGWGPNPGDAIPCATGTSRPFVASRTPRLRARVSDPDGGSLKAGFRVYRGTAGSHTWDGNETVDTGVPSGSYAEIRVPSGVMSTDAVYSWNLYASDGQLSAWSGTCEFQVDTIVPGTPTVRSLQYPDGRPAGGVGQSGTFTIAASTATNDTAYYLYGFTEDGGEPATKVTPSALNGSVTVAFNPRLSGPQTLSVRAVDRAGNRSGIVEYHVIVADYQVGVSGKVAHWSLEDSPRDSAGAKDLTYQGPPPGPAYDTGHQGQGVVLDPDREEYYEAKDALVRTDTGFTVSAWAKLTRNDQSFTVAAQDGDVVSGFYLAYHKELDRWVFMMPDKDQVEEVQWYYAASAGSPMLGEWTHLVGVYDVATSKIRLYVDGVGSEGDAAPTPWNATGHFTVGAAASEGKRIQYFPGAIDSVRAHPRALTATEVTALHAGTATANPTVEYRFEDNLVNSGADYDLMPKGSMTYGPGYSGRALDSGPNTQGWAESRGPVLHTTGSYSVAAWVKLADKAAHYHVASQDGSRVSGFVLRYAPDVDRWIFGVPPVDSDTVTIQWAIGKSVPQVGVWTHLAAVHDVAQHKLLLYVNGVLEAEKELVSTIDATGAFVVGQAKYLGGRTGLFKGMLDEVDAYDGALTAREVADLANLAVERARYRLDETGGRVAHDSVSGADTPLYGANVTLGQNYGAASGNFTSTGTEHTGTVSGAGPLARWDLNSGLTDATGNSWTLTHRNASGAAAATYTTGRLSQGVVLNGVDQYLTAAQPVADTSGSYSVSAWVKPDRADSRSYTVAAQNGATFPFQLRYAGDLNRWVLTVTEPGGVNPRHAMSTLPPLTGYWTHLLGVVDVAAGKARLYVNGHLEGEVLYTAPWASTGYLMLGRAVKNGVGAEFFPGALDEVRVYDRALTASDANSLWNLGSDITVPRPAEFRTDQSFTIAGWVRPAAYGTAARMAFSLGADRYSPLAITYRPEWQRWVAEAVVGSETAATRQFVRVLSDNEASSYADTNGWVHLAAVYDGPAKQLRLYVNGVRQSTVPTSTTTWAKDPNAGSGLSMWDSGRDLQIGRLTYYGAATNHWNGAIRDVRVFSGVLPEACDNAPTCLSQLRWQ